MKFFAVDGVVEAAELRRRAGKFVLYSRVRIDNGSGDGRALERVAAAGRVAQALTPGARGRFYLTEAFGHTGMHGMWLEGGAQLRV